MVAIKSAAIQHVEYSQAEIYAKLSQAVAQNITGSNYRGAIEYGSKQTW